MKGSEGKRNIGEVNLNHVEFHRDLEKLFQNGYAEVEFANRQIAELQNFVSGSADEEQFLEYLHEIKAKIDDAADEYEDSLERHEMLQGSNENVVREDFKILKKAFSQLQLLTHNLQKEVERRINTNQVKQDQKNKIKADVNHNLNKPDLLSEDLLRDSNFDSNYLDVEQDAYEQGLSRQYQTSVQKRKGKDVTRFSSRWVDGAGRSPKKSHVQKHRSATINLKDNDATLQSDMKSPENINESTNKGSLNNEESFDAEKMSTLVAEARRVQAYTFPKDFSKVMGWGPSAHERTGAQELGLRIRGQIGTRQKMLEKQISNAETLGFDSRRVKAVKANIKWIDEKYQKVMSDYEHFKDNKNTDPSNQKQSEIQHDSELVTDTSVEGERQAAKQIAEAEAQNAQVRGGDVNISFNGDNNSVGNVNTGNVIDGSFDQRVGATEPQVRSGDTEEVNSADNAQEKVAIKAQTTSVENDPKVISKEVRDSFTEDEIEHISTKPISVNGIEDGNIKTSGIEVNFEDLESQEGRETQESIEPITLEALQEMHESTRSYIERIEQAQRQGIEDHPHLTPLQKGRAIDKLQRDYYDYLVRVDTITPETFAVSQKSHSQNRVETQLTPFEQVKESVDLQSKELSKLFVSFNERVAEALENQLISIQDTELAHALGFINDSADDQSTNLGDVFTLQYGTLVLTNEQRTDLPLTPYEIAREKMYGPEGIKAKFVEAEKEYLDSAQELKSINLQLDELDGLFGVTISPKKRARKKELLERKEEIEALETAYMEAEVVYQNGLTDVLDKRKDHQVDKLTLSGATPEEIENRIIDASSIEKIRHAMQLNGKSEEEIELKIADLQESNQLKEETRGAAYYQTARLARAFALEGDTGYRRQVTSEENATLATRDRRSVLEKRLDYKKETLAEERQFAFEVFDEEWGKSQRIKKWVNTRPKWLRYAAGAALAGGAAVAISASPARVLVSVLAGGVTRGILDQMDSRVAKRFDKNVKVREIDFDITRTESIAGELGDFEEARQEVQEYYEAIDEEKASNDRKGLAYTVAKTAVAGAVGFGAGAGFEAQYGRMSICDLWRSILCYDCVGGGGVITPGTPGIDPAPGLDSSARPPIIDRGEGVVSTPERVPVTPTETIPSLTPETSLPDVPAELEPRPLPELVSCLDAERTPNFDTATTYTVEKGDTLWDIAEGQKSAAQPSVFSEFPNGSTELQVAIDTVIDALKTDSHAQELIGVRDISTNPNLWLYTGEPMNLEAFNEFSARTLGAEGMVSPEVVEGCITPEITLEVSPDASAVPGESIIETATESAPATPEDTSPPTVPTEGAAGAPVSEEEIRLANEGGVESPEMSVARPDSRPWDSVEEFLSRLDTPAEKKAALMSDATLVGQETLLYQTLGLGNTNLERTTLISQNNPMYGAYIVAEEGKTLTGYETIDPRLQDDRGFKTLVFDPQGRLIIGELANGGKIEFPQIDGKYAETLLSQMDQTRVEMIYTEVADRAKVEIVTDELFNTIVEREAIINLFEEGIRKDLNLKTLPGEGLRGLYDVSSIEILKALKDNTITELLDKHVTSNEHAQRKMSQLLGMMFADSAVPKPPMFKDVVEMFTETIDVGQVSKIVKAVR